VLACAIEKVGVDTRRIHTLGMSAGGLHTAQMSLRRSNYIASAVPYSGGIIYGNPPNADPSNKFAAMIFHGGETDVVAGADFEQASNNYKDILTQNGNFAFICNHGEGHTIPQDALPSVWQFLQDHPYGTDPSPYAGGLPQGFPAYCAL
jgi:predicted esterase